MYTIKGSTYVCFQYIFTDEENRHIFTTRDYGTNVLKRVVPFKPAKILIHKTNYKLVLGMDNSPSGNGKVRFPSWQGEVFIMTW